MKYDGIELKSFTSDTNEWHEPTAYYMGLED